MRRFGVRQMRFFMTDPREISRASHRARRASVPCERAAQRHDRLVRGDACRDRGARVCAGEATAARGHGTLAPRDAFPRERVPWRVPRSDAKFQLALRKGFSVFGQNTSRNVCPHADTLWKPRRASRQQNVCCIYSSDSRAEPLCQTFTVKRWAHFRVRPLKRVGDRARKACAFTESSDKILRGLGLVA